MPNPSILTDGVKDQDQDQDRREENSEASAP